MKMAVSQTLEMQDEIIRTQSEIIDRLALELLQYGMMSDEDLNAIKNVAMMQEKLYFDGR